MESNMFPTLNEYNLCIYLSLFIYNISTKKCGKYRNSFQEFRIPAFCKFSAQLAYNKS